MGDVYHQRAQKRVHAFDLEPDMPDGVTAYPDGRIEFRRPWVGETEEDYYRRKRGALCAAEKAARKKRYDEKQLFGQYVTPRTATAVMSHAAHQRRLQKSHARRLIPAEGRKTLRERQRERRKEKRRLAGIAKSTAAAAAVSAAAANATAEQAAAAAAAAEKAAAATAAAEEAAAAEKEKQQKEQQNRRHSTAAAAAVPSSSAVPLTSAVPPLSLQQRPRSSSPHAVGRHSKWSAAAAAASSSTASSAPVHAPMLSSRAFVADQSEECWDDLPAAAPYFAPVPTYRKGDSKRRNKALMRQKKQQQQQHRSSPQQQRRSSPPAAARHSTWAAAAEAAASSPPVHATMLSSSAFVADEKEKLLRETIDQHFYWSGDRPKSVVAVHELLNDSDFLACQSIVDFCNDYSELFDVEENEGKPHLSTIYQRARPKLPGIAQLKYKRLEWWHWDSRIDELEKQKEIGFDSEFFNYKNNKGIRVVSLFNPADNTTYVFHCKNR
jgi:hypothetical protein